MAVDGGTMSEPLDPGIAADMLHITMWTQLPTRLAPPTALACLLACGAPPVTAQGPQSPPPTGAQTEGLDALCAAACAKQIAAHCKGSGSLDECSSGCTTAGPPPGVCEKEYRDVLRCESGAKTMACNAGGYPEAAECGAQQQALDACSKR